MRARERYTEYWKACQARRRKAARDAWLREAGDILLGIAQVFAEFGIAGACVLGLLKLTGVW